MDTVSKVGLRFSGDAVRVGDYANLSAVHGEGRHLWLAGDESASIHLLTADDTADPVGYGDQLTMPLSELVTLPEDDGEVDIEGLARCGRHLWAVGSHSLVRKKIKRDDADADGVERLAQVEDQRNRRILVRLEVEQGDDGRPRLVRQAADGQRSALLGRKGRTLTDVLADDPHLGPFLAIPAKDNGFDVEGLAVRDDRVYVGLRGPVLRGWAVVLQIRPQAREGSARLRLQPFDDGDRYRKHFLDLAGLGVRDLCPDGDDLLVLAGPTMALDGPVRVYRWRGAATQDAPQVVRGDDLTPVVDLPYGVGEDHPEGITFSGPPDDRRLLVVYDSPAPGRIHPDGRIAADLVPLT